MPGSREESKGALDAFQALRALSDTLEVFVAKLTTELSRGECTVHMDFSIKGESVGKTEYFCPTGRVDLSGFDLRGANLTEARLADADMSDISYDPGDSFCDNQHITTFQTIKQPEELYASMMLWVHRETSRFFHSR